MDMHVKEAKKAGETDERLHTVAGFREAPWFSDAERAALALAEFATRLSDREDPCARRRAGASLQVLRGARARRPGAQHRDDQFLESLQVTTRQSPVRAGAEAHVLRNLSNRRMSKAHDSSEIT